MLAALLDLLEALFPLVCGFALRSLVMEQHHGWYSWAIAALTGACYTFGFILMTPQVHAGVTSPPNTPTHGCWLGAKTAFSSACTAFSTISFF